MTPCTGPFLAAFGPPAICKPFPALRLPALTSSLQEEEQCGRAAGQLLGGTSRGRARGVAWPDWLFCLDHTLIPPHLGQKGMWSIERPRHCVLRFPPAPGIVSMNLI